MRINLIKKSALFGTSLFVLLCYQNCSEQKFATIPEPVTLTGGPNCREQLKEITTPIELVFVVDVSGSNAGKNATDLNKVMRAGSISKFLSTYKTKTNFEYSMITFAKDKATTHLAMGDADDMAIMLSDFQKIADGGSTPFKKALDESTTLVTSHTTRKMYTKYVVVFMSDGVPNPAITDADLKTEVEELVATLPGEVSLNTLYYGPKQDTASARLRTMAQIGGGNFLDTNANPTGNSFLISDLVLIPGVICD